MTTERYCFSCGDHVRCREESLAVPGTARTMLKLFCPKCGKELGAVYDAELRIEKTPGVAR